jgi:anion-transporting  ArsA/GET3 family ATPase
MPESMDLLSVAQLNQGERLRMQRLQYAKSTLQEQLESGQLSMEEADQLAQRINEPLGRLENREQDSRRLAERAAEEAAMKGAATASMLQTQQHKQQALNLPNTVAALPDPATGEEVWFHVPPDGSTPTPLFGSSGMAGIAGTAARAIEEGGQGAVQQPNQQQFNQMYGQIERSLTTTNAETGAQQRPTPQQVQEALQQRLQLYQEMFPQQQTQQQPSLYQQAQMQRWQQQQGPQQDAVYDAQGNPIYRYPNLPGFGGQGQGVPGGTQNMGWSAEQGGWVQVTPQQRQAQQQPAQPGPTPSSPMQGPAPTFGTDPFSFPAAGSSIPGAAQVLPANLQQAGLMVPTQTGNYGGAWTQGFQGNLARLQMRAIQSNQPRQAAMIGFVSRMLQHYRTMNNMPASVRTQVQNAMQQAMQPQGQGQPAGQPGPAAPAGDVLPAANQSQPGPMPVPHRTGTGVSQDYEPPAYEAGSF